MKWLLHKSYIKLKARTRNEAILVALIRGEISLNELYSLDEIAERFISLDPDMLRRIANLVRKVLTYGHPISDGEQIIRPDKRQDAILTQAERDVLILTGYGLTNKEIASRLFISISAVRAFLYRACIKLGACKRADAVVLALKCGEISASDIFTPSELIQILARMGADSIEKMAELVDEKLGKELVPLGS